MIRAQGCKLPIEVWTLRQDRNMDLIQRYYSKYDVIERIFDDYVKDKKFLAPIECGSGLKFFHLKTHAILHSSFLEVLYLEADNVPVKDPTYLFDHPIYRTNSAIFWPGM